MITIQILINGVVIFARSARNQLKQDKRGRALYHCDSGQKIWHRREDGAVRLAHKLLDTIEEP